MTSDSDYGQRSVTYTNLSQCVRHASRFPEVRAALFGRGAEYLDGMIAAEKQDYSGPSAVAGLHDYVFLGYTMPLEQRVEAIPRFPQWSAALRAGAVPEEMRHELAAFFDGRAQAYHSALQGEATARAIRDDE